MRYAEGTAVSVEKSRAEIESCVRRYGATGFISGWRNDDAMITFEIKEKRIRFMLPLPSRTSKEFTHTPSRGTRRDERSAYQAWEQACRQRWRALALAVKAKLEAVECGIASFEEEFLAYVVMPNGMTIGEAMIPQLPDVCATGKLPPLLPGPAN